MRLPSEHGYKKSDFYKKHLQTGCEVVYNNLRQRRQKKAYGLCHTLRYFLYAFFVFVREIEQGGEKTCHTLMRLLKQ